METLDTNDLKQLAKDLGIKIKIVARDSLPKKLSGNYVINLDRSDGKGTHWTCMKIIGRQAFYFDSYGIAPPQEIVERVRENKKKGIYITNEIQCLESHACGWYAISFLKRMETESIHEILVDFSDDCKENEKVLQKWFQTCLFI